MYSASCSSNTVHLPMSITKKRLKYFWIACFFGVSDSSAPCVSSCEHQQPKLELKLSIPHGEGCEAVETILT